MSFQQLKSGPKAAADDEWISFGSRSQSGHWDRVCSISMSRGVINRLFAGGDGESLALFIGTFHDAGKLRLMRAVNGDGYRMRKYSRGLSREMRVFTTRLERDGRQLPVHKAQRCHITQWGVHDGRPFVEFRMPLWARAESREEVQP